MLKIETYDKKTNKLGYSDLYFTNDGTPYTKTDRAYQTIDFEDGTSFEYDITSTPKILNSKGNPIMGYTSGSNPMPHQIRPLPSELRFINNLQNITKYSDLSLSELYDKRQTALDENNLSELNLICDKIESRLSYQKQENKNTLKDNIISFLRKIFNN